ncbi:MULTISPECIES: FkbM family methyltransferase [unclassified Microcystis]|jgi:FkbM family methyltransferase|uniref:FkbM family methyltransferase n=1 Tax=unclassified Microcystis TaxID=2643300 RepID=UPI0011951743|nr:MULTISPECIES: FkbM family methyltransferase [unclassified Microcystis]MCA2924765.1 FkbM family methyltransferase [Microcystis sp. M020S1]MCA2937373.1 FkbM family methyltransferase [Microcystis sp. M015S1]MCA2621266.1 FkbM family methyltransferase [Microcystis sp. M099S2]MCA2648562.1 FkbM family methyltransferase [Microcystis sp. M065S2]MCA2678242.1 FkbM family methyltransferase [Microcystis sp. M043S2]
MMKQLLAKNKIVQRVKAVKDLFLEKLDSLSHVQLEQIQKLEKLEKLNQLDPLDFKVDQLNNSTEQIRQENAETRRKADLSMENQAFLLKFSVDIVKNLQLLTEDWKQKGELILNTLLKNHEDSQKTTYQQSGLILDTIQKNAASNHQQIDFILSVIQKIQEDNQKILEDIHAQKYKVIIDQKYFQDLDIELMTYLYSYLPHRLAVDIGANRGDVSSRLLQAGYQVYAFEPFPPVIDKLKNRLGNHPNFRLFPLAIGSENQTQELHIATDETPDNTYQDASFYSSLTKHSLSEGLVFTDTIPVTVKTLASLHDAEELPKDIGLVKIDTEGFDLEVIKGMGNYRYPVVVAEFWDQNFPFGRSGAMNQLPDLVNAMKERDYHWHLVIYRIWGSSDVSYYCNSAYSLDNSWGNVFFFQDYHVFHQALLWSASVMPATYFSA